MNEKDKENIEPVIFHCKMFEYGFSQTYSPTLEALGVTDPIPRLYNEFAGIHLISTMFLLDKGNKPMGGFCYRVLKPIGLEGLLDKIREIMELPVGNTTFGDFTRHSRNKLTVHGDLSFASLPSEVKEVPFNESYVEEFQELLEKLAVEVKCLEKNLMAIIQNKMSQT